MSRFLRALLAGALSLALGGCPLFPRKADLESIHDTYRSEFASTFLNEPKAEAASCAGRIAAGAEFFPKTLQAIRDYDVKYAGDPASTSERAHLVVLKAMIHLQAGNTAIARSMTEEVGKAPIAATDDREVRDSLFQKAYPYLAAGWTVICERQPPGARDRIRPLADAAAGVVAVSGSVATAGKPVTDEGAIYLAATGAIFYRHAFEERVNACVGAVPAGQIADEEQCRRSAAAQGELQKGAAAIGKFLSPDEKEAAKGTKPFADWARVVPAGRVRYLQWYVHLSEQAARYPAP